MKNKTFFLTLIFLFSLCTQGFSLVYLPDKKEKIQKESLKEENKTMLEVKKEKKREIEVKTKEGKTIKIQQR